MNLSEGDSRALNTWQKLCFNAESSNTSPSSRGDAWRRLLIQIHTLKRSNKVSCQLYTRFLQTFVAHYCQAVDNQEPGQGLNNFAETVLALVSGCRNESQNWSSGLSLECLQTLPIYNSILTRKVNINRDKATGTSVHVSGCTSYQPSLNGAETENIDNNPLDFSAAHSRNTISKLKDNEVQSIGKHTQETARISAPNPIFQTQGGLSFDRNSSQVERIKHEALPASGDRETSGTISVSDNSTLKGNFGIKRKATSHCLLGDGFLSPVKKVPSFGAFTGSDNSHDSAPVIQSNQFIKTSNHFEGYGDRRFPRRTFDSKQRSSDPSEQNNNEVTSEFITARQKLLINSKRKNGHQESDAGFLKQGAINSSNYGSSRKTLGTRRGPNRQFVPPVLNNDQDKDGGLERKKVNGNEEKSDPEMDERLKNIEPKMVELITNEIMDHGPPVSWDDIAGLEFAKSVIKEIVVWPMLRPDIFKGLRGPPKGVLLFGPPGTGKTLIGKCIASQSKATFFSISASSLTSKWVGEGEKMVRALFAVARCHLPAVIFIDEIDSLLSQRTDGEHDASRRIKTEFLVQLDGATTNSDDRLLVVGATNRPQEIDEAARRRLVKRLYIPLPDPGARQQIMHNLLSQQSYSLSEQEIKKIVQQTHGYSGSDMANLCREAALGPIRNIADIQCIEADQVPPIVFRDFDAALHQVRASVSEKDLDLYLQWNKLYGSGTK